MSKEEIEQLSFDEIMELPQLFRNNLINSISGFKSANMIGTQDPEMGPNLAVFSSVTHFGSNPPILGFVTRPTTVPRNTYKNIKNSGYYTVNHINSNVIVKAHQTSAKYDEYVNEFEACELTEFWTDHPAPYVEEANIQVGMQFLEEYQIKANGTILVLGKILEVRFSKEYLKEDGFLDLQEADTVTINGLDGYLSPKKLSRFNYARPNQTITEIK